MSNEASVQAAALEAAILDSTGTASVQAATLEAAILNNAGLSEVKGAALEVLVLVPSEGPQAIASDIVGVINTPVTFNGSSSVGDSFLWQWTSVPASSSIANYPTLYPDSGASEPFDMTDNEVLFHFNGNANDTSGNSNSLTLTNTAYQEGIERVASSSLGLSGTNSKATLGTDVDLSGGSWTIAFWFYNLKPTGSWRTGVRGSTADHQIIVENNSDRLGVYANNNGNFRYSGFDMPSANYQGWHHIAAVGSGTTTTFYVDGVLRGSSDRKSVSDVRTIGNFHLGNQRFADRIDEFAIWSRALSASEIADIYDKQGKVGLGSSTSTATFTPDVVGTYIASFTAVKGGYVNVSTSVKAVIAATAQSGSSRSRKRRGRRLRKTATRLPGWALQGSEDED